MHKVILLFILSITMLIHLSAQCEVDAGENRNICPEEWQDEPQLSGKIISGDVVQTRWEAEFVYDFPGQEPFYEYASRMLSDTTILDPTITRYQGRNEQFYLTGITSNGAICRDTVVFNYSRWLVSLPRPMMAFKQPNDTISLWTNSMGIWKPIQYAWTPNYMISDTTAANPLVWGDTAISYQVYLTDALGCTINEGIFETSIVPVSTNEIQLSDLKLYPNPVQAELKIDAKVPVTYTEIYNESGQYLGREMGQDAIDLSTYPTGFLILKVKFKNEKTAVRKVLKIR